MIELIATASFFALAFLALWAYGVRNDRVFDFRTKFLDALSAWYSVNIVGLSWSDPRWVSISSLYNSILGEYEYMMNPFHGWRIKDTVIDKSKYEEIMDWYQFNY